MTENIFAAGEIIEALNDRLVTNIKNSLYKRTEDPMCEKTAKLFVKEHTKAIIDVTVYERETVELGKCCSTCAEDIAWDECKKHCNWQPRITKATFGLEE